MSARFRRSGLVILMLGGLVGGLITRGPAVAMAAPVPVAAAALPPASVTTGGAVALAMRPDGSVWGWGSNFDGTLGDGTTASTYKPSRLSDLTGVTAMASGWNHSLAVKSDGTVWSWGSNEVGQLGDGAPTDSIGYVFGPYQRKLMPSQVPGLSGVIQVAAGFEFSLALKADGTVWAWGEDRMSGSRGDGGGVSRSVPSQVPGLPAISSLSAGLHQTLALAADGSVWHWGRVEATNADAPSVATPHQVSGVSNVTAVAAGDGFSLALRNDGTVWAWGEDGYGQLGNGPGGASATPAPVSGLTDVKAVSAGDAFGLAIKADGTLWGWGGNGSAQLGTGTGGDQQVPVAVPGLSNVIAAAGSGANSAAMTADGELWTWGTGDALGDGTPFSMRVRPYHVQLPVDTAPPSWSADSSVAIMGYTGSTGTVTWTPASHPDGVYRYRVFVDGVAAATTAGSEQSVIISGLRPGNSYTLSVRAESPNGTWSADGPTVTANNRHGLLAAGGAVSMALKADGVFAWGANSQGQAGNGLTSDVAIPVRTHLINDPVQLATDGDRTVILRQDGTAWEWGMTAGWTEGTNTPVKATTEPVKVTGLSDLVSVASSGSQGRSGATADGAVWRWWDTGGTGGLTRLEGLEGRVLALTGGAFTTLGLAEGGQLFAWDGGQPVGPVAVTHAVTMAVGETHALVVKDDGTVWAWGSNSAGQLGDPYLPQQDRTSPVLVDRLGSGRVTMVAAGAEHSVALKADGSVWTWGAGAYGQLGTGSRDGRPAPMQVPGLSDVVAIAAGGNHTLAMKADGTVWAWGDNWHWQLGDGTQVSRLTPVLVAPFTVDQQAPVWPGGSQLTIDHVGPFGFDVAWPAASDDRRVAAYRVFVDDVQLVETAQNRFSVAVVNPAHAYSVAVAAADPQGNWSQQLTGTATTAALAPESLVRQVSAAAYSSSAVTADGLWIWGIDPGWTSGFVNAPSVSWPFPIRLTEPGNVVSVANGGEHTLALLGDGTVWAWGSNNHGQLGTGTPGNNPAYAPPMAVAGLSDVKQVAAAEDYSLALKNDGTVWAWGSGSNGRLGGGSGQDRPRPVRVAGLTGVVSVVTAAGRTLALKSDGTVWGWGLNEYGQVGDGTTTDQLSPVQVTNLSGVTAVAAGLSHSVAVRADGTVWAWGSDNYGQLGDASYTTQPIAVQVAQLSSITAVAAGDSYSVALGRDGSLWAWGRNDFGQLGDGTRTSRSTPKAIPGFSAKAVAAGYYHNLAIRSDDSLWAWGNNVTGTLGSDTTDPASRPVPVQLPLRDQTAPSWMGKALTAEKVERTSVSLNWPIPADAGYVAMYRLYQNGALIDTAPENRTSFEVSGLTAETTYRFQVQARDAWGNWSLDGPALNVKTANADKEPPQLLTAADGKPHLHLGMDVSGKSFWTRPKSVTGQALVFAVQNADRYSLRGFMNEPISRVTVNGIDVPALFAENSFTCDIPITPGAATTLIIAVYDRAGNKAVLPQVRVEPDNTAPTVTISTPAEAVAGVNRRATISGTASEDLLDLLVWVDGADAPLVPTEQTVNGRAFRVVVELTRNGWSDGDSYPLRVIGVDYAVHFSPPAPGGADRRTFVTDSTPPEPPVVLSPALSNGRLVTATTTVTLSGNAEAGARVTASTDSQNSAGTVVARADANGVFTVTVPVREGESVVELRAEDWAGNTSDPAVYTVKRDTLAPALVSIVLRVRHGSAHTTLTPAWTPQGGYAFSVTGAEEYVLEGVFGEPLGAITRNGESSGVTLSDTTFSVEVPSLSNGRNVIRLAASDELEHTTTLAVTINVETAPLTVSVALPAGDLLIGPAVHRSELVHTFSGTASQALQDLRVVAADAGMPLALETTAQIDPVNPRKWTARVRLPLGESAQWSLRFEGQDLAGNWSTADKLGRDRRTVTVDLDPPVVTLPPDLPEVIYANGTVTLVGTASDSSGIKRLVIGQRVLTPPKGQEKAFAFRHTIDLRQGGITTLTIYAEDNAGNRSEVKEIRLISRSSIGKLSVSAKWSRSAQTLTIAGATDAAFPLNGGFTAAVPLTVTIKNSQGQVVEQFTLDASSPAAYDLARGTFTVSLQQSAKLSPGRYTVQVTATAPAEMPWIAGRSATAQVVVE